MKNNINKIEKFLIFRVGSLGDAVVSLPSIWAIKNNFPFANLSFMTYQPMDLQWVLGWEVFKDSGFFDQFINYSEGSKSTENKFIRFIKLVFKLRKERYDALVYLAPNARNSKQLKRDYFFFKKIVGIKRIFGFEGFFEIKTKISGQPLPVIPSEADLLLARLSASGLKVPPPQQGVMDLRLNNDEEEKFKLFLSKLTNDNNRSWIGLGLGSKMPAKVWPIERYVMVVRKLVEIYDVWPVIVGGAEDALHGEMLIKKLGRGFNFSGKLPVRLSAVALRKCKLYLGNDTGTMHLAAAVGTPCVAIFSSRGYPGQWFPYGQEHIVFYKHIECEGCDLEVCIENKMQCILSTQADEVLDACSKILEKLN